MSAASSVSRAIRRHGFTVAVVLLLAGIAATGAFLVKVAGPDLVKIALVTEPSPSPSPSATPAPAMALSPVGIAMPEGSDCEGCHTTDDGVGTKAIPVMAHPLWGWRDCTACHAQTSLVKTAPGHSGLHADQCLVCHQTQTDAGTATTPPMRPEHMGTDKPCTACHGVDKHAPLPESMQGRGDNCWICHNGAEYKYLFEQTESPGPDGDSDADDGVAPPASAAPSEDPAGVSFRLSGDWSD
jgi:hypothetical protein